MENKKWRSSSRSSSTQNNHQSIYLLKSFSEHPYGRFEPPRIDEPKTATRSSSSSSSSSSRSSKMQGFFSKLRRKFTKEKKTFGSGHSDQLVIVPYNIYTYSKNFDDKDLALAEPDNLSRSFSARFAASSTGMFKRVQSVR